MLNLAFKRARQAMAVASIMHVLKTNCLNICMDTFKRIKRGVCVKGCIHRLDLRGIRSCMLAGLTAISLSSCITNYLSKSEIQKERFNVARNTLGYTHIKWDPDAKLNSLEAYKKRVKELRSRSSNNKEFLKSVVDLVAQNYKHKELKMHWSDNWIGYLLAASGLPKLKDFDSEIRPEAIAQSKYAFCSQVSILIATLLEDNEISYHSIGFSGSIGHFAIAAYTNKKGYFLDANMKPVQSWDGSVIPGLLSGGKEAVKITQELYPAYRISRLSIWVDNYNQIPAHRIRPYIYMMIFVSHWAWIPSLIALCNLIGRRDRAYFCKD